MSLIPSESLNFPDSFRAKVGWRISEDPADEASAPAAGSRTVVFPVADAPTDPTQDSPPQDQAIPTENIPESGVASSHANGDLSDLAAPAETSESQLELMPEPAAAAEEVNVLSGSAEMQALLAHFLSSGSAIPADPSMAQPAAPSSPEAATSDFQFAVPFPVTPQPTAAPNEPTSFPEMNEEMITPVALSDIPADQTGSEPQRELPREPVAPENGSPGPAPTAPAGELVIETPAQANHVLQLIAAAVERGTLVGKPVTEAKPAPAPEPIPTPAIPQSASMSPDQFAPGEQSVPSAVPFSPPVPIPPSDVKKTPARIRITPRKIKPRPQVEPTAQPSLPSSPLSTAPSSFTPNGAIAGSESQAAPPQNMIPETATAAPAADNPKPRLEPFESSARKIAPRRAELAQSDLLLFTARERRNRWIGFGLSELAVLTALILLGHYGFTHHFPDPTIKLLVFILVFVAAAIAVALPIAFLRNDPKRWQRER
jgi:hypothetical protein